MKRVFPPAMLVIVLVLIVISIRFIMMAVLGLGIGLYDSQKPYEDLSGIENYDKGSILEQYGSDLDSGLFVFPDETSNAAAVDYKSSLKTGLFDSDGSIILTAAYTADDFNKEIERLSSITCTVFETKYDDSAYHVGEILYDPDSYNYPAYVASDGYDYVYEYALLDADNSRIIYVLLSYPDIENDGGSTAYRDFLKKDKKAYDLNDDSAHDNFSIYSYCFSKGVWSEYSPDDEGRVPLGIRV